MQRGQNGAPIQGKLLDQDKEQKPQEQVMLDEQAKSVLLYGFDAAFPRRWDAFSQIDWRTLSVNTPSFTADALDCLHKMGMVENSPSRFVKRVRYVLTEQGKHEQTKLEEAGLTFKKLKGLGIHDSANPQGVALETALVFAASGFFDAMPPGFFAQRLSISSRRVPAAINRLIEQGLFDRIIEHAKISAGFYRLTVQGRSARQALLVAS
jgi:DNA-binding MarR family transcriptional regulator